MKVVSVDQAAKDLTRLIKQACQGEDIVIVQGTKPVVRLVPVPVAKKRRRPGALKGRFRVGPEFFDPLPLEDWDG